MGAGAGVRDPMGAHHWGSAIMVGLRGSPLPYFGGGVWAWRTQRNGTARERARCLWTMFTHRHRELRYGGRWGGNHHVGVRGESEEGARELEGPARRGSESPKFPPSLATFSASFLPIYTRYCIVYVWGATGVSQRGRVGGCIMTPRPGPPGPAHSVTESAAAHWPHSGCHCYTGVGESPVPSMSSPPYLRTV